MKRTILTILVTFSVFAIFSYSNYGKSQNQSDEQDISGYIEVMNKLLIPKDTIDSWEVFYLALTFVESSWDTNAYNPKSGALGLIQCMPEGTPGYIDEANRLIGRRKYTNESRTNPIANREIFDIVNHFRNPGLSFKRAIELHNPGADDSYSKKILEKYDELRKFYIYCPTILYLEEKLLVYKQ